MTEKIMQRRPPLTHLDLYDLNVEAKFGERLLHALHSSITEPTLLYLNLGGNSRWWEGESRFPLLLNVLEQQHNLDHLDLSGSEFSSAQTEQLLRRLTESVLL